MLFWLSNEVIFKLTSENRVYKLFTYCNRIRGIGSFLFHSRKDPIIDCATRDCSAIFIFILGRDFFDPMNIYIA